MIFVLLVFSNVYVFAIPHPLSGYDLSQYEGSLNEIENLVRDKYSTFIETEKDYDSIFIKYSYATFWAHEVVKSWVNRYSDLQFYTNSEKAETLNEHFNAIEINNTFQVYLYSDINDGYKYTELDRYNCNISRIVLETDKGIRIPVNNIYSDEGDIDDGTWENFNILRFPVLDPETEKPYITKETKWIKIWLISNHERFYFQFNFDEYTQ